MFMDVPVRRINQVCDRMSQDGYDLDSVARTRLRLMLEDEPMPCLQALEEYYRTGRQTDLEWKGTRVSALMQKLYTADPSTGARGGTCSSSDPELQPRGESRFHPWACLLYTSRCV